MVRTAGLCGTNTVGFCSGSARSFWFSAGVWKKRSAWNQTFLWSRCISEFLGSAPASSSELLADWPGRPQAPPPAVLVGPPGPQEVPVGAAAAAADLQVELSLQSEGERSVPPLLLDDGTQRLLLDARPAPLWVQVQVFGLLLPLLAPP